MGGRDLIGLGRMVGRGACAIAAAFVLGAWSPAAVPSHPHNEKHVLLLLPADTATPWIGGFASTVRAGLEHGEDTVFVFTEDIDVARFEDPAYPSRLQAWLAEKYAATRLDLIIAPGTQVMAFLDRHAPQAWLAVPVVTVHEPGVGPMPAMPGGITGFATELDVRGTLEEALVLVPGTRRVAVVSGASPPERARAQALTAALKGRAGVEVLDFGGLAFGELVGRLRALADDTIVLFLSFRMDADGRSFLVDRVASDIAAASTRPVFSVYEPLVGLGIAGGRVTSFEAMGNALAAVGGRVLGGEPVAGIPFVRDSFARSVYDARALARHRLDPRLLPVDAEVRYREKTLLEQYRWGIFAIIAAFLLQAVLIGALLVERERRRRAEGKARRTLGQLAHLDRVAAMGELATSLAHELNQPLAAILANAQAARRLMTGPYPDLAEVRATLDDIVDDDKRAGEVIRRMRALLKKEEFRPEPVDLNDVVRTVLRLLAHEAVRRGVTLETDLAANLPRVRGDVVQLQQVVLNLVVNACDAVARCPPERRRVLARTRERLPGHLEILVEDAGDGVPDAHVAQLFEPFFTTKAEGLGMGLSITRSILELHGGRIEVQNLEGGGACFRCVLPAYGRSSVAAEPEARAA